MVGLGGVGKTRLALEAATTVAQIYADGVCFVPLADVDSTADVAAAILRRLGLPRLPRSKVMLHSRVSDPARLGALRTLAAGFRRAVAA